MKGTMKVMVLNTAFVLYVPLTVCQDFCWLTVDWKTKDVPWLCAMTFAGWLWTKTQKMCHDSVLWLLLVDFGPKIGIKKSSAQITHYYNEENLVGKQVIGVCNFPQKNIAGIISEVLILGAIEKDGKVVLLHPSQKVENGLEIA